MKTFLTCLRLILEPIVFFILYAVGSSVVMMGCSTISIIIGSVVMSAVLIGVYALVQHFIDKRSWSDIFHYHRIVEIASGFGYGAVFLSAVVGVIAVLGCYEVVEFDFNFSSLITTLFLFLYVGVGEEIAFRGSAFKRVEAVSNVYVAMAVSGLLFGFIHITNSNATVWSSVAIAIEAGCMLGAAYAWKRTLLFPIGIHWAWNYFEGYVYGTNVSGNVTNSLLVPEISGSDIITGGSFGPEASVIAVVLGALLTVYMLYMKSKQNA